jgi:hypothetical protein
MTLLTWPIDDLDRLDTLKSLLGGYWTDFYPDSQGLEALLIARALLARRDGVRLDNALATLDRTSFPVNLRQDLYALNLTFALASPVAGGYVYGRSPRAAQSYPAVAGLRSASTLVDTPLAPNTLLVHGIDYRFESSGAVSFVDDPTAGNAQATLLARPAELDLGSIWLFLGSLVGLNLTPSSSRYLQFVNALLDASYNGPSYSNLLDALEAISDAPAARVQGETVLAVTADNRSKLVVTDQSLYRCPLSSTVLVSVGQVLNAQQQLCDAVAVYRPPLTSLAGLPDIVVSAAMVDPSLTGPLTFYNSQQTLTVTTGVSGFTKITWPIPEAGAAGFFSLLHSRGVAASATLANYLDLRPQPQATQPTAASLPVTINPAQLLLNNVLRNHWTLVVLKAAAFGSNALGTAVLPLLRVLTPPEAGVLVLTI